MRRVDVRSDETQRDVIKFVGALDSQGEIISRVRKL